MPHRANIFILNDTRDLLEELKKELVRAEHTVIATATTVVEAVEVFNRMKDQPNLILHVALIDNVVPWSTGGDTDVLGSIVEAKMRTILGERGSRVISVACTTTPRRLVDYGDSFFSTAYDIGSRLGKFVDELPASRLELRR